MPLALTLLDTELNRRGEANVRSFVACNCERV
jgi:hypothetical protein